MLKNISRLQHVIGDRVFHLLCDSDSPLTEVRDSILEFLKFIGRMEDAAKQAQEQQKELENERHEKKEESSSES